MNAEPSELKVRPLVHSHPWDDWKPVFSEYINPISETLQIGLYTPFTEKTHQIN
jgi:hypothetical protein